MNSDPDSAYPNPTYAWFVVAVLFLAYTVSYIDRQIMSLLVEPIKADLGLSDTQVSLLHGFAFTIFYTIAGIPLGRLADRRNRRAIIAAGICVWSFMTAACGLARTFAQLFLARIGVGVGEACLSPAAYSLIADYFPKHKRGIAISLYSMAIYVGSGLSFIVGALIVERVTAIGAATLPLIGEVRAWQATFFLVGLPGIAVVALMATVREPLRRELLAGGTGTATPLTLRETIRFLLAHKYAYGSVFFGMAFKATISYGYFAWIPSLFVRSYGWDVSRIGYLFGLIVMLIGTAGIITGGVLADRAIARKRFDAHLRVSLYAAIVAMLCGIPIAFMPSAELALLCLCPTMFCLGFPVGLAPGAVNFITPNEIRGQAMACYIFFAALIGMTCGPTVIALITDYVFHDPLALRYSIAIFTALFGLLACVVLGFGMKPYRASAQALTAGDSRTPP